MRTQTSRTRRTTAKRATPDGTARYAGRFGGGFAPDFFRQIADALTASSIGVGTYLGQCDYDEDERYVQAVERALSAGINLLDTAINYRCQRSERAVGRALGNATAAGRVRRDEIVVCTKGGYIPLEGEPPDSRDEYEEYVRREFYGRGIMAPEDVVAGGHCMAPRFLADQLKRSLANLQVQEIDVYYLHNPEQQLEHVERATFESRLRVAFELLEERVARGDIGVYGCATWNGLRVPPGTRGHLSLPDILGAAREVAGDGHHFRVVQLPINLAMSEAVRAPTQRLGGRDVPLLEAAAELGVSVVASAPLLQAQLASGLPEPVREAFPGLRTDAQRALAFVRSLPGVSAALVGMRSTEHLEENLEAFRQAVPQE